ncbi:MAG: GatB/YqeY domain-containing protein [Bacteroidales bacterium]|nr:GatB/YqeY domain-containing protein [Bacteroidales bacterium]
MNLFDKISEDLKSAMLARQKDRLESLRAIKTALLLAKTESGSHDLSTDQEMKILQKMVKQRRESAEIYKTQNREELYQNEIKEAAIIEEYLPKQMNEDELVVVLKSIIQRVGATSPKDMGKVMGTASKELSGKADGKMIADKVKELLAGL